MIKGDWSISGTKVEIEAEIGEPLNTGWGETATDTYYLHPVDEDIFRLEVWNRVGVREELKRITNQP